MSPQAPTLSREERIEAFNRMLDAGEVKIAFQPIIELATREVYAYEALARPGIPEFSNPIAMFEAAVEAGRVAELGRHHRVQAMEECRDWPLFINIFPPEFDFGWVVRPDDPLFRHRHPVVLEITEAVPLRGFAQCHAVLTEIRRRGVAVAIDDLGAGYSNLKYIADLAPAFVKLDREMVTGVRLDTRQFQLVKAIVGLCHEMGARVVAEGIETALELAVVRAAGADYCQGYLLARPAFPPPEAVWPAMVG